MKHQRTKRQWESGSNKEREKDRMVEGQEVKRRMGVVVSEIEWRSKTGRKFLANIKWTVLFEKEDIPTNKGNVK